MVRTSLAFAVVCLATLVLSVPARAGDRDFDPKLGIGMGPVIGVANQGMGLGIGGRAGMLAPMVARVSLIAHDRDFNSILFIDAEFGAALPVSDFVMPTVTVGLGTPGGNGFYWVAGAGAFVPIYGPVGVSAQFTYRRLSADSAYVRGGRFERQHLLGGYATLDLVF